MYRKMLVPLDGSDLAELALPYAEELAGKLGAEVILAEAVNTPKEAQDIALQVYLQGVATATAQNVMKHVPKLGTPEIRTRTEILVGNPAEALLDYAEKQSVDLIVMATHGRTGIRRWALGSVATKIATAADCPVVLIRARGARKDVREKGAIRRILVPLDGSKAGEKIIPYVRELIARLKAEVTLFQAIQPLYNAVATTDGIVYVPYTPEEMKSFVTAAEDYLGGASAAFQPLGVLVQKKVTLGDPAEEIIRFADEIGADLVAMATHGRTGIHRWMVGSVADKVLHAGNTPLFLVRTKEPPPA